jgi:hypothetical protein
MTPEQVQIVGLGSQDASRQTLPLFGESVMAGFPSPADDYVGQQLNLHEHLVEHPGQGGAPSVEILCRQRLGGLLKHYCRAAA